MSERHLFIAAESSLVLIGLGLLWRLVLQPLWRKTPPQVFLPRWEIPPVDFFLYLWVILGGGAVGSLLVGFAIPRLTITGDVVITTITAGGQLGMIVGFVLGKFLFDRPRTSTAKAPTNIFFAGVVTFLISLPIATVVSVLWQKLLELCGLPAEKQDLIRMFVDAESPQLLVVMVLLACVGAPIAEELSHRAGIFRFARTRLPRWAALLLPACLFAAQHNNLASFAPLAALGVIFSLAYERTGHIGTSMVAHGLFNLNVVLLIVANVDF